jgi:hypothetical protein
LSNAQFFDEIVTFFAIPLIIIIGLYLLSCTIGSLVDLNNQTFKIIFTLIGGFPTLIFYFKKHTQNKITLNILPVLIVSKKSKLLKKLPLLLDFDCLNLNQNIKLII